MGASFATLMSYILMFFFRIIKIKNKLNVKILLERFSKYCCLFITISLSVVLYKSNFLMSIVIFIISALVFLAANFEIIRSTVQSVSRRLK